MMPTRADKLLTYLVLFPLAAAAPLMMGAEGSCGGPPPAPPPNELISNYVYANGDASAADVSEAGQFVAFELQACYEDLPCTPGNVYLRDRINGWVERVSRVEDGAMYSADHGEGSVSFDGTRIAFRSVPRADATPPAPTTEPQIYIVDWTEDAFGAYFTTTLVSAGPDNTLPYNPDYGDGDSSEPDLSGTGRYVVFTSEAANLVDGDTNGASDIFRTDLDTGAMTRISVAHDGGEADGPSRQPVVSFDGRFIAFVSDATNIVPGDTNGVSDVFLYDDLAQAIVRISVKEDGSEADAPSQTPSLSTNGTKIAFESKSALATTHHPLYGDTGYSPAGTDSSRIVLYDHSNGSLRQITQPLIGGWAADERVSSPAIDPSGSFIAYQYQCVDCSNSGATVRVWRPSHALPAEACSTGTQSFRACAEPAATTGGVVLTVLNDWVLPGDGDSQTDIGFIPQQNWIQIPEWLP